MTDYVFSNYETKIAKLALDRCCFGSLHNVVEMYQDNVVGLALFLKELYIEQLPDGIPDMPYKDLLRYTIDNNINFEELAESYLEEADN